jgi:hypothetical protein
MTRPTLVLITTRELNRRSMAGRFDVAFAIHATLNACSDLTVLRLPNILTELTVHRAISMIFRWLKGLIVGPMLPFQCALFQNSADHRRLMAAIPPHAVAVYLDGVRCYSFLVRLRRERPDLHIVVDFDDLMSRRMALLLEAGQSLSLGYLTQKLPSLLQRIVMSPLVGRNIVRYERVALAGIEKKVADLADRVVLLSSEDARVFEAALPATRRAIVTVVPPPSQPAAAAAPFSSPKRFVFIGSETQTQNRLTMTYLTELWRVHRVATPLVLVGYRWKASLLPENVASAGYVEDIADIYDGRSVLITPSFIGGGVKTKVLEAFAHGAAVIGNPLTFEAMEIGDYPLNIADEDRLVDLVSHPERHADLFAAAAAAGADYIREHHDPQAFAARWREIMQPAARS